MAPRLNKRQQRELDELNALSSAAQPDIVENEAATEPFVAAPTAPSGFGALRNDELPSEPEDDDHEQPNQSKSKPKKAKKKKKALAPSATTESSGPSVSSKHETSTSTTAKPKGKGVSKKDDFDAALEEMAEKYPELKNLDAHASKREDSSEVLSAAQRVWQMLRIEPKFLDGDAELRRFFGSKVVNSARTNPQRKKVVMRSQLVRPAEIWYRLPSSQGLSMRPLEAGEQRRKGYAIASERWWTTEHSMSYKKVQYEFLSAVAVGDPNELMHLVQRNPWHIDTLLQLSEVFRHQEDWTHANDLVNRAIFAYERSFHPSFNVTSGIHRLDFDRIENRPFYLALHRQIIQLIRRGCTRTAFEWGRLLLSLDPSGDPHGALLYLDFLGPKSGMNTWVLDMWDMWDKFCKEEALGPDDEGQRVDVRCLPGWSYARALALWNLELDKDDTEHKESSNALKEAILAFPSVLPVLADKAGIELSVAARSHPALRIETGWSSSSPGESAIHLLSHLYAHRSSSTWKQPTHVQWVQSVVPSLLGYLPNPSMKAAKRHPLYTQALNHFSLGPTRSICRHIIITENRSLLSFFPPQMMGSEMHAYDPFPPESSVSGYDDTYFGRLVGLQAINQRNRRLPQMGGGGGIDRMMQQMIIDMQAGRMPGGFDGEAEGQLEHDEGEGEDEDEDGEDHHAQLPAGNNPVQPPPGLLQTLYNRLFGQIEAAEDSEPDEE